MRTVIMQRPDMIVVLSSIVLSRDRRYLFVRKTLENSKPGGWIQHYQGLWVTTRPLSSSIVMGGQSLVNTIVTPSGHCTRELGTSKLI